MRLQKLLLPMNEVLLSVISTTLLVLLVFAGAIILFFHSGRQRMKKQMEVDLKEQEKVIVTQEKQKYEELLLNILPYEVAQELKEKGKSEARAFESVTVMFTDFKGFTKIAEQMSAAGLVKEIDYCFSEFDKIMQKYGIEKIKTIGDSYMCAGGLPAINNTHATDILNAAIEVRTFMLEYKKEKDAKGEPPFEVRIGINTGPVIAGIVGIKKFAYDIWGDTVNIASRMESSGEPGKINISGATHELVKDKFKCIYRGKIEAKNKGEIDMYFVER
jgi:adenylate cyclase